MIHPYRTKKKILQTALQSITRNGIRAFRVEDMARNMGISKRTVYQLFPTKAELVGTCIRQMNETTSIKISFYTSAFKENPLLRTIHFMEKYIDGLYEAESVFWQDLKQSDDFYDSFLEIRKEWLTNGEKVLHACKKKNYLQADSDLSFFNKRLLTGLFESRLADEPYSEQFLFYRIMLRGIATEAGRIWLEKEAEPLFSYTTGKLRNIGPTPKNK